MCMPACAAFPLRERWPSWRRVATTTGTRKSPDGKRTTGNAAIPCIALICCAPRWRRHRPTSSFLPGASLATDIPLRARVLFATLRLIRQHNIGVICLGELISSAWLGELCRRLTGCRLIYYIHGEEVTTQFDAGSFGNKRLHNLARADAIVAVSRFTERTLVEELGLPAERVHLIENAVDTGKFSPGPDDHAFRQRWGVSGKRLVVGVGRLVPRKGFDHTLRGWHAVLAAHPAAHLMIVGDGPQRQELQAAVVAAGLQDHVTLTGPLSDADLVAAYRSADVFIMPNRTMPDGDTEGFGLVFLEANACGRAVVGGPRRWCRRSRARR